MYRWMGTRMYSYYKQQRHQQHTHTHTHTHHTPHTHTTHTHLFTTSDKVHPSTAARKPCSSVKRAKGTLAPWHSMHTGTGPTASIEAVNTHHADMFTNH